MPKTTRSTPKRPPQPEGARPAQEPPADTHTIDLDELTAAVERLLLRELVVERERLGLHSGLRQRRFRR